MLAMYGATVGRTAILGIDASTNQAVAVGQPKTCIINTFLQYYLLAQKQDLISRSKGGAQLNISQGLIKKYPIPLPPLAEQRRIVARLDALLGEVRAARERLSALPGLVQALRQAVLSRAVSGELTKEWRERNPEGESAEELTLMDIILGKPRNGYSPKAVDFPTQTKSLSLSATTSGQFDPQYIKYIDEVIPEDSHLWLEDGDILIQRSNTLEYVGVSAIFRGGKKEFIYPDLMMKIQVTLEKTTPEFIHIYLSSEQSRIYFRKNATGTSGNMPKINQRTVMNAPIILPPVPEQQEIVRRVEAAFAAIDALEERYAAAWAQVEALPGVILGKAFRGELSEEPTGEKPPVGTSGL